MRRAFGAVLLCACCIAEPVCHAFGIPHPEGLSTVALNYLATR